MFEISVLQELINSDSAVVQSHSAVSVVGSGVLRDLSSMCCISVTDCSSLTRLLSVLQQLALPVSVSTAECSVLSVDTASKLCVVAISWEESFALCCCKSVLSSPFASHTFSGDSILT